ncbi:hypothetical protein A3D80_03025 [Candidatus Roizmanbacteria bacterium RIFCSPHIGHO2_02_FULL_40_13b]|uniref:leucine--tRNA ligase n=1 Tax=Candidatus Roizmanbacteria bacterium RIFCSPHIGHO2_01_FULL_39_24 TaxID=1802032 RepID=A0A1F7GIT4_9BACT|nr:MAG: hypothetical protein A2799_02015 [Candidatus Roizmanbacteria bacterium RIFCSPHIGHO2_01_FULL_39_24]OGK27165.1 MAG: hypothetical protein A3D80_03025 [Candidatus Roizmanbacteria bacterium RIFCSPHIGHO2_02_FULL_40_13b]OGK49453.1 MAG: hypothetical protein A3A56_00160 [Candidatus Roizmanbacteria bacterium RIFCSPLOWO2_01_FULL_40_32]
MNRKYTPKDIEPKIAQSWDDENIYKSIPPISQTPPPPNPKKAYILVMFPYPSGEGLHTGHARVYTGTDVLARFFRMKGKSVLHPMGFDAFGLPAENAAIKLQKNPIDMVPENIANFKRQMKLLGLSYDWSREFSTTDPEYYKWTQWLFIQFFKMGLLHKKETPIFYCPNCKTGLAQEEVLEDGTHERCGTAVEERNLPQWIFRITKYADRLLDDLEGLDWPAGILQMQKNWIGKKVGKSGESTYHLRDWIFSRQRYWGEPIPMIFCDKCAEKKINYWEGDRSRGVDHNNNEVEQMISGFVDEVKDDLYGWFPVEEKDLPLKLPYVKSYMPTESGQSPLSQIEEFVHTTCPHCGSDARRETDTMPNWAGSNWYFLYFGRQHDKTRPPSLQNWKTEIGDPSAQWLPVDWYLGGAEHAVLHLLYARFWVKAMKDIGLVSFSEPFAKLRSVGMVLASDNRKMSKSLGNVVNPDDVVSEYGADTLRVYEMFMAPFGQEVAWSESAIQGAYRFLQRIWQIFISSDSITENQDEENFELVAELQSTISRIESDITNVKFNTSISTMMEFINLWEKKKLSRQSSAKFLQILAPFAPFMTDYLWREILKNKESIHISTWPSVDKSVISIKKVTITIQVNGKMRGVISFENGDVEEKEAIEEALKLENVKKYVVDDTYKVIYVKERVLNFVV